MSAPEALGEVEPRLHFVWYGQQLPDFAAVAIASAMRHNPECSAVLWHEPGLQVSSVLQRLAARGLQLAHIDFASLAAEAEAGEASFRAKDLTRIYERLKAPAARSNLLRQLALYVQGGIYLDTDTLTLRSLAELRKLRGFCGLEHVLWPTGRPKYHLGTLGLDGLRWLCGRIDGGHALHQRMLRFYEQAANNAVLGFRSRHPFSDELLRAAAQTPRAEWGRRFRFGTHLLQQQLADQKNGPSEREVRALPPGYFYPQGPVISLHYFRTTRDAATASQRLLGGEAHVIHWYSSVSKLLHYGAEHIARRQHCEVYSHLCSPYLELFESDT